MAGDSHLVHTFDTKRTISRPIQAYAKLAQRWSPSLMTYGAFAGAMFLYFTDWKIFMDKVPFYNKKFEPKEPII